MSSLVHLSPTSEPNVLNVERQPDAVTITLRVPEDLCYFEGHFPGCQLLPGVVQTKWAVEFARREYSDYFRARPRFTHMANIKFMRVIVPGKTVTLKLSSLLDRGEIAFEYRIGDHVCSSGQLGFAAA